MGEHRVDKFTDSSEKRIFTQYLLNDIRALERMLEEGLIESDIQRIGAEQEICLVNENWHPSMSAVQMLDRISDEHYTTELAQFNAEINLDPHTFTGNCFKKMESQLVELLEIGREAAAKEKSKILLTGILPTIQRKELEFRNMTPNPRYEALNEIMKARKGSDFELYIVGLDELITKHQNILFEACNTSFQIHLQIKPQDFTEQYNWAQMIAGPVLAACANSPILMGKRLWSETRIALFQQSVDTRNSAELRRDKEPRVSFGKSWLTGTVAELYKDNISRYSALFASDDKEDSLAELDKGNIPKLKALVLHNGTVYKWNRACYGVGNGKPHLRIENRYIPSGPSVADEMANAAFWLGLMVGMPAEYKDLSKMMAFDDVRYNFYNAARTCLDSTFKWFGKPVHANVLLRDELLPLSRMGLQKMKVDNDDIDRLLGIIDNRLGMHTNGSKWMLRNFSELLIGSTPNEASVNITKALYKLEQSNKPLHLWPDLDPNDKEEYKQFKQVNEIMITDIITVKEDDLLDLVINLMDWNKVRYIMVENNKHELVGLISSTILIRFFTKGKNSDDLLKVGELMRTDIHTVDPYCSVADAVKIMADKQIGCLPVVSHDKKLVGLITESLVVYIANSMSRFE